MSYENIKLEKEDHLAILTINRPNALNTLNRETLLDISEAIEDVKDDTAIKVISITGSGSKAFVAGATFPLNPKSALRTKLWWQIQIICRIGSNRTCKEVLKQ
jgi:enoyl-CoA hydratase/carnithine racemase